jgi:hypothetical protein
LLATVAGATAAVALGLTMTAAQAPTVEPLRPGTDEMASRVVDKAGAGVTGVQVWGMEGDWFAPDVVARATTDDQGRYLLPGVVHLIRPPVRARTLMVFARAQDGRVGWRQPDQRGRADLTGGELEILAVGDARGRLIDQDGRPIGGVEVTAMGMNRTNADFVWLSP